MPVIQRCFHEAKARDDARIVDQSVQGAEFACDCLRHALPIGFARDVERHEPGVTSMCTQFSHEAFALMLAHVADHNGRAALRKQANRSGAESERAPGNQHDLIAEIARLNRVRHDPHSAKRFISAYRSDLPSKPMPGSSGIVMKPCCTRTPSGKPPYGWNRSG